MLARLTRWILRRRYPLCHIHVGVRVNACSSLGRYVVLFPGVSVLDSVIGDHTYVQKDATVFSAEVGKFCSIAGGAFIGLPQHATAGVSSHPAFYLNRTPLVKTYSDRDRFEPSRRTWVGHDVWIGQNALVMGGITIGTGAVIGAGAVVTHDVPAYAIVGGVPARLLKYRFDPDIAAGLLASNWWDTSEAWRESHRDLFDNPRAFVARLKEEVG